MIVSALAIVLILFFRSGALPGIVAGCIAVDLYLRSTGTSLDLGSQAIFILLLLAMPLAGLLTVALLERFLEVRPGYAAWRTLVVTAVLWFMFASGTTVDFLEASIAVANSHTGGKAVIFFAALMNSIFFVAALVSSVIFCVCIAVELPLRWYAQAGNLKLSFRFQSLRLMVALLTVSIGINLILPFFASELAPTRIVKSLSLK